MAEHRELRPKKRFGQHFLHDPGIINKIIAVIGPVRGQRIVEIGPGTGVLTLHLLQALGELDVIELDRDLIAHLAERFATVGLLRIHAGDALRFRLNALAPTASQVRLVGNLPYNVATPILFHFLEQLPYVHDMTFMVQREVADRLTAKPGTSAYGRLSIMIQHRLEVETLFDVAPGAFHPPPKVYSSVVRLRPRAVVEQLQDFSVFKRIVQAAFSQRRKTLRNALKGLVGTDTFTAAGIDGGLRPEVLAISDFAALANLLCDRHSKGEL